MADSFSMIEARVLCKLILINFTSSEVEVSISEFCNWKLIILGSIGNEDIVNCQPSKAFLLKLLLSFCRYICCFDNYAWLRSFKLSIQI